MQRKRIICVLDQISFFSNAPGPRLPSQLRSGKHDLNPGRYCYDRLSSYRLTLFFSNEATFSSFYAECKFYILLAPTQNAAYYSWLTILSGMDIQHFLSHINIPPPMLEADNYITGSTGPAIVTWVTIKLRNSSPLDIALIFECADNDVILHSMCIVLQH